MRRWVLGIVAGWLLLAGASLVLRRVEGESMRPTLEPGDVVLVLPLRAGVRHGDVVTVVDPRRPGRITIKRVVALEGELTDLGGDVSTVPAGHVAVRGDHAARSTDSRRFGAVPLDSLRGRVLARLWPSPAPLRGTADGGRSP